MAKKGRATPAPTPTDSDAIATAIHRLADTIVVLRDAIAEIREDIQWVTHNGLPLQPIVHTVLKRMARDPCAANWSQQLEVTRYVYPPGSPPTDDEPLPFDRIRDDPASTIEAVAQGHLEVVLTALDSVRDEILAALQRRDGATRSAVTAPASEILSPPTPDPPPTPPPRGRLF